MKFDFVIQQSFLLTDWLTDAFKQAQVSNSYGYGLSFHCSMSLQPDRCLLACRSAYNAPIMDLLLFSFVSVPSLTAQGVNLR